MHLVCILLKLPPEFQISFEPEFGAYQGLAQKIKVPFFQDFSPSFCSFQGLRANSKPAPSPGTHQTLVETLSENYESESESKIQGEISM